MVKIVPENNDHRIEISVDAISFSDILEFMNFYPHQFLTQTLAKHPQKEKVLEILSSAIQSVEPANAVRNFIHRDGDLLKVNNKTYDLLRYDHIYIIAIGKAARAMSEEVGFILADRLTRAYVVPKQMFSPNDTRFEIISGGHPVPNQNSILAGQMIEKACQKFTAKDLVFCLISGGGSALVTLPVQGLLLPDLQNLTSLLLASGARIDEINTLRRHLDNIKGGGLARMVAPASLISLILSDVVNSPLETIASGPTAPDPSTLSDAFQVLEKYQLTSKVPESILDHLQNGIETLKQNDPIFELVQNVLIADNFLAAKAAGEQAQKSGLKVVHLGNSWQGEARKVASELCNILKSTPDHNLCLIAGGETTVTISGQGSGGRNQELALAAISELAGMSDVLLVTLATDGEDGPTDAAGAVVSGLTAKRAKDAGLSVTDYLNHNDSYHFFEQLGDLLKIGSTGTNVNDLTFLFRF